MNKVETVKQILKEHATIIETQEPNSIIFVEREFSTDYLYGVCDALGVFYDVEICEMKGDNLFNVTLKEEA